eukprot:14539568-Ditylum_brightwellii.AAC.1
MLLKYTSMNTYKIFKSVYKVYTTTKPIRGLRGHFAVPSISRFVVISITPWEKVLLKSQIDAYAHLVLSATEDENKKQTMLLPMLAQITMILKGRMKMECPKDGSGPAQGRFDKVINLELPFLV